MAYNSIHTGQEIDAAVTKAAEPDTVPQEGSDRLITSGAVWNYVDERVEEAISGAIGGSY